MTMDSFLGILVMALAGWQFATCVRFLVQKASAAIGRRAARKRDQHMGSRLPRAGCECGVCSFLRQNAELQMTPNMVETVQLMLVTCGLGVRAVVHPIDQVGPNGVSRTVIAVFSGAVFDQVVSPALSNASMRPGT